MRTTIGFLLSLLAVLARPSGTNISESNKGDVSATSSAYFTSMPFKVYHPANGSGDFMNLDKGLVTVTSYGFFKYNGSTYDYSAPNYDIMVNTAKTWPNGLIFTADIESWYDQPSILKNFHYVINTIKGTNPSIKMGFYAFLPKNSFWEIVPHLRNLDLIAAGLTPWRYEEKKLLYENWQKWNAVYSQPDAYSSIPLANRVDYTFPSCYTFYRDAVNYPDPLTDPAVKEWEYHCKGQIDEARKYGKPVIPFLWPMYHPSGTYKDLNHVLEGAFFKRQLEYVYSLADSVVIWDGALSTTNYLDSEWYSELQSFVAKVRAANTDTEAPIASISSPIDGQTVGGTIPVSANVSDNVGVTKVEFFLDGKLLQADSTSPFTVYWNTASVANGSHTLAALAYDAGGNIGKTSTVGVTVKNALAVPVPDGIAPLVVITSPTGGSTVSGIITVSASATDNVGVARVEVYQDGTLVKSCTSGSCSLSWDTRLSADGSHRITVKAYDAAENMGSTDLSVITKNTVEETPPPAISITSPTDGSVISRGSWITIQTAPVVASGVSVRSVDISVNGNLLCTRTSAPFSCDWKAPKGKPRYHSVSATVYDTTGKSGTSSTIKVLGQ